MREFLNYAYHFWKAPSPCYVTPKDEDPYRRLCEKRDKFEAARPR